MSASEPPPDCRLCPRLAAFRDDNRRAEPDWRNAPVPSFGPPPGAGPVRLLIVGLAPGLRGANRTGRPFTGDDAGELLHRTLLRHGLARGDYRAAADDGLTLVGCRITNAVRCVPPGNKPTGDEVASCRRFLRAEIDELPRLAAILAIGGKAHDATLAALEAKRSRFPFAHGAVHDLSTGLALFNSYHCSRYNVRTHRLTVAMFDDVVGRVRGCLESAPAPS